MKLRAICLAVGALIYSTSAMATCNDDIEKYFTVYKTYCNDIQDEIHYYQGYGSFVHKSTVVAQSMQVVLVMNDLEEKYGKYCSKRWWDTIGEWYRRTGQDICPPLEEDAHLP